MITWKPISNPPDENQTIWVLDEDNTIFRAVYKNGSAIIENGDFRLIGITHWANVEEINLPE
jgi:hypothetical protein